MDVKCLLSDELEHELKIWGMEYASGMTVAQKRKLLGPIFKKEKYLNVSVWVNSSMLEFQPEIDACKAKINSIETKLADLVNRSHPKYLTRALHLARRIDRIPVGEENDESAVDDLKTAAAQSTPIVLPRHEPPVTPGTRVIETEAGFADQLAGLLDASFQRLEDNRHSHVPIRKWGVSFSGTADEGATDLFTGSALIWFRSIRDDVSSWTDLVTRIRTCFLPGNFELMLWDEIRARKQGVNEAPLFYIATMKELFSRFSRPPSPHEQLMLIMANLQPFYATPLSLINVDSVDHLNTLCLKLENARTNNSRVASGSKLSILEVSSSRENISLLSDYGKSRIKRKALICWNCRVEGHDFRRCVKELTQFCFLCGAADVTVPTCPRQHLNCVRRSAEPDHSSNPRV
ncbi:hypothetical protein RN001_016079 [Aquatica leii]|uniref:Retrotransposon gag domain-containing protein n=1 Tax=Aquatica leii TaxID=1421715 RepID=A0AAN7PY15_9COLE|nr:hypothetical protein RN001_016079 [Aquatica leii]